MRDLIEDIFGTYQPVTYTTGSGMDMTEVVASGAAGVDWTFVAGVILFGITLFCVIKIIGAVIKNV